MLDHLPTVIIGRGRHRKWPSVGPRCPSDASPLKFPFWNGL